jgi:hypothetical protein
MNPKLDGRRDKSLQGLEGCLLLCNEEVLLTGTGARFS